MADYGTSVDEVYDRALMLIEDYRIDKLATLNPSALSTYLRAPTMAALSFSFIIVSLFLYSFTI